LQVVPSCLKKSTQMCDENLSLKLIQTQGILNTVIY